MRLVGSSIPGAVERDAGIYLLAERAVLTRAVRHELQESDGFLSRRPLVALGLLLRWIQDKFPKTVVVNGPLATPWKV